MREFQLWHVSEAQLEDGYVDFAPWRGQCRFRDCRHEDEPGCAIKAAVAAGKLDARRLEHFVAIATEGDRGRPF